jgi:hypothetical protein
MTIKLVDILVLAVAIHVTPESPVAASKISDAVPYAIAVL